jgi:hypothetical protein
LFGYFPFLCFLCISLIDPFAGNASSGAFSSDSYVTARGSRSSASDPSMSVTQSIVSSVSRSVLSTSPVLVSDAPSVASAAVPDVAITFTPPVVDSAVDPPDQGTDSDSIRGISS